MKSRVKTPKVLQMELTECGAACLGIILGFYGSFIPLSELRCACGISRDGSKAANIVKAAKSYGLVARGFKKSLATLMAIEPPYIVFWNFNHFLVVEGFAKDKVYLNDPATGSTTVSLEEFNKSYTGVVLTMKPGATFNKVGKPQNIWSGLFSRLRGSYVGIIFCLIAGFFLALPRLVTPTFTQVFIDRILIEDSQDWLRPLILAMITIVLIQALLRYLQLRILRRLFLKLSISLSSHFLWHSLHLPADFYSQRLSGEFSNRTILNDRVADVLTGRLATSFIDFVMMGLYALLMLTYDVFLTSITVTFATLNFAALYWIAGSRVDLSNRLALEQGKLMGFAVSNIQSIETIKSSGLESDVYAKFADFHTKVIKTQQNLYLKTRVLGSLPVLLNALAIAAVLIIGGFRVIAGELSIGMLVAYQLLALGFLRPIEQLVNFGSTIQELEADIGRLDDVLQNPVEPSISDRFQQILSHEDKTVRSHQFSATNSFQLEGYLELRNLTFGYNKLESPLIQDFSLSIKPGQRVAFVGATGSGKSTIAKLIGGLYLPWQGEVLFDNVPRDQISSTKIAASLSIVEQDICLFSGTVRENLTLWDRTIPDKDLVRACEDAAIHETILKLPRGYDTSLSEGGQNLSGGQRQRLEIARALARNPSILILDEATSALEPETELIIDNNLRRGGYTCVIVAHRLSTIRDCDEIIVLDKGQVVQRGTHESLKDEDGLYVHLLGRV